MLILEKLDKQKRTNKLTVRNIKQARKKLVKTRGTNEK